MRLRHLLTLLFFISTCGFAQDTLSINLENVKYPYPVHFLSLNTEGQDIRMAFMDVKPSSPNGKTFILFHGKNFGGYYWTNVIKALSANGYRVIVPDQIGFGKSSKPFIHYSFHGMARWNKKLLDTLGIGKTYVLGHSMGGMLATRFALMYPAAVQQLLLENPIGLEDYRTFVPYRSAEDQYKTELKTTAESVKTYYQGSYFTQWKPEYDYLVEIGSGVAKSSDFPRYAKVAAMTFEMIYEQPVCYEFVDIKVPTVLFIGQKDNTIVGKALLSEVEKARHGRYAELGPATAKKIPGSQLVIFPQAMHIPHVEIADEFLKSLLSNIR
ncbi:alpha/beta fold hydrolase [Mucilaginibacter myungsuensis]|uniref:Alpha/beta hydrolase n=1 Tax=Mucilaginibacter myungsuensis TaxID=649104 RepID=A0A929KYM3_9SPHI|nr:alpha/beta hydrolase [Mucilaginibacter myungsuensis]MBE9661289.1 alpha/beta hydrolase [Mucilaginibacter myungsuensis]MDN3597432.1 alpha/beta hydrolase [Mucilaginibacter myungsuensis]